MPSNARARYETFCKLPENSTRNIQSIASTAQFTTRVDQKKCVSSVKTAASSCPYFDRLSQARRLDLVFFFLFFNALGRGVDSSSGRDPGARRAELLRFFFTPLASTMNVVALVALGALPLAPVDRRTMPTSAPSLTSSEVRFPFVPLTSIMNGSASSCSISNVTFLSLSLAGLPCRTKHDLIPCSSTALLCSVPNPVPISMCQVAASSATVWT